MEIGINWCLTLNDLHKYHTGGDMFQKKRIQVIDYLQSIWLSKVHTAAIPQRD